MLLDLTVKQNSGLSPKLNLPDVLDLVKVK